MKKLLLTTLILFGIGVEAANATVWQYGLYQERAEMAAMCGIFGYRGTAEQNLSKTVQDCFKSLTGEVLGFSVITRYRTTLSSSMTSFQSTIPVSSMKTFDGTTITMSLLGSKVYLTVEPGTTREEIIKCTGIYGSSWTGCTRGLAFSGTDESSVAANREAHNAGSAVVISNVHYVYEELIDKDSNNTSTAKIISKDMLATSTMCLYDTNYCFRVNDGMIQWTVDNFANSYNFTSSTISQLTASSTRAIGVTDSKVHLNISDNAGLAFDNSTGYLETLLNNSITSGTDGLAVNTSTNFTWTGTNTFSATTTFTGTMSHRGFGGIGTDGALSITAGATTTLDANYANVVVKNYSSINIPNTAGLTLSNASTSGTILILKSQGDCTIGGNVWLKGFGVSASATTSPYGFIGAESANGVPVYGKYGAAVVGGAGGAMYGTTTGSLYTTATDNLSTKTIIVIPGSRGGHGADGLAAGGVGGAGGAGGGALIIECGGYLNFTGSIVVDGGNGANGADSADANSAGGGGGGGGSAGMAVILYNGLISNTGTIYARGGAGGNGGTAGASAANNGNAGGGGGGCWASTGKAGAAGDSSGPGTNGTATTNACGASGASGGGGNASVGGTGGAQGTTDPYHYYIGQNYWF